MAQAVNQSPGNCACGCTTTIGGNVKGCNSVNAPGVTVEAHDSTAGGTLLASTTTNASGNYTLSAFSATSGNSIVLVFNPSSPRFASATKIFTFKSTAGAPSSTQWKCSDTTASGTTTLTAGTDYHCIGGCSHPIYKDLPFTSTLLGAGTLSWTAGTTWQVDLTSSYVACGVCPGGTNKIRVTINLSASPTLTVGFWNSVTNPTNCPGTNAVTSAGWQHIFPVRVCEEAGGFSFSSSITKSFAPASPVDWHWHSCTSASVAETLLATE